MKGILLKIAYGSIIVFFVYCIYTPEEILPPFFSRIISLRVLSIIVYPAMLAPVGGMVIMLVTMRRTFPQPGRGASKNNRQSWSFPLKSKLCFLASIGFVLVITDLTDLAGRSKAKEFLCSVSSNTKVTVNGQIIEDPQTVIATLNELAPYPGHGSHATDRIHIEIGGNGESLVLELGRDSRNSREYWVFYPKHRYTSRNEIGRITTDIFDGYYSKGDPAQKH